MRKELTVIKNEKNFVEVSLLVNTVVLLTILSFPHFFFFLPNFSTGNVVLASIQTLSQLGWIIFLIVPPVLLFINAKNKNISSNLFVLSVLLWPASTLLIKLVLLIQTKNFYLDYLVSFPIFIFLEFIAPAIYLYMYLKFLRQR